MALAVQHFDQSENEVSKVAPKVEKDGFAPQDRMVVQVDTPVALPVLCNEIHCFQPLVK